MNSIARHLDEFDVAQEVRMERTSHKGAFLLLEGATDIKRMSEFLNPTACSPVNSYGRPNALAALHILLSEKFEGVLAVVDADFDRILCRLTTHQAVVYSETHDLDLDWAKAEVVGRYLFQVGDANKCKSFGSTESIIATILEGLRPISVARLLNRRGKIRHKLKGVDVASCFVDMAIDLRRLTDEICNVGRVTSHVERRKIFNEIKVALATEIHDPFQITNGHDFNSALGVALRSKLGSRRDVHTWGSEIEVGLRLAFSKEDFRNLAVCGQIKKWQSAHGNFSVLLADV